MFGKIWTVAMAAAITGVLALPAPSAYAQAAKPAPAKAKPMAMHMAAHHRMSCYDYAWQSQAMQDCLAKKDNMKSMKKSSSKKMMKKKMS
ncbi:MAG TPA: hypothetical protein VMC10_11250 [Stellaceae bacterium]|nr:hypothetical protein [Stellaceae bacterium]